MGFLRLVRALRPEGACTTPLEIEAGEPDLDTIVGGSVGAGTGAGGAVVVAACVAVLGRLAAVDFGLDLRPGAETVPTFAC